MANTGAEPDNGTTVTANTGAVLMSRRSTATWEPSGTLTVEGVPVAGGIGATCTVAVPRGEASRSCAPAFPPAAARASTPGWACVSGLFAAA